MRGQFNFHSFTIRHIQVSQNQIDGTSFEARDPSLPSVTCIMVRPMVSRMYFRTDLTESSSSSTKIVVL
jgi:hypothetical protein